MNGLPAPDFTSPQLLALFLQGREIGARLRGTHAAWRGLVMSAAGVTPTQYGRARAGLPIKREAMQRIWHELGIKRGKQ